MTVSRIASVSRGYAEIRFPLWRKLIAYRFLTEGRMKPVAIEAAFSLNRNRALRRA